MNIQAGNQCGWRLTTSRSSLSGSSVFRLDSTLTCDEGLLTKPEGTTKVKNVNTLMVRYLGSDGNRYHVVQRGDGLFWTGRGWSRILDCAEIFRGHRDAQARCIAIQRMRYRGKPARSYRLEVTVTLCGNDVAHVTEDKLVRFLQDAVRIDVESSVFGDGPLEDVYLEARLNLTTLAEI
jgi:hypothetical protein